jgi:hypothetical protein
MEAGSAFSKDLEKNVDEIRYGQCSSRWRKNFIFP